MKVLYILNSTTRFNGANKSLLASIDQLLVLGVTPIMLVPDTDGVCEDFEKRSIKYEIIRFPRWTYPRLSGIRDLLLYIPKIVLKPLLFYRNISKVCECVIRNEIDIIHTNVGPIHSGHYASKRLKIPHVWHIREYQDLDFGLRPFPNKRQFIKKLNRSNNHKIVITKGLKVHFSINRNYQIISDGVLFEKDGNFIENKEKYFLFAGRLEEGKGIKDLLFAYVEFCKIDQEYSLLIAGDSGDEKYKRELRKIVSGAEIHNRVQFLGMRSDIYALMSKAYALIVPSRFEGFGMITAEAMFNGCLVIGNNAGGTREILYENQLGILYSGKESLVVEMKSVVDNGIKSYFPMLRNAQSEAKKLYSIEQNGRSIYNYYLSVLSK